MNKNIHKYKMQGKTVSHKNSLIKSLIMELVRAEKIKTTPAKAKIIKSRFDRLVTTAKKNGDNKRSIESFFTLNEKAIQKFYKVIDEKLQDRNSGYTRIFHTLPRKGDNAEQVYIMLVNASLEKKKSEVDKLITKQKKEASKKTLGSRLKKVVSNVNSEKK